MAAEHSFSQSSDIAFEILGVRALISATSPTVREWVALNFGSMLVGDRDTGDGAVSLVVEQSGDTYHVFDPVEPQPSRVIAASPADLLYRLEKLVVIEIQKRRSDLLFLHAAAVERDGRAYLLAGDTGAGKSTTTWGLLRHGFGYLSDELGPIDLQSMEVLPYPHALNLKRRTDPPYSLPGDTLDLGRTLHVPTASLDAPVVVEPRPLGGVFLLRHDPRASAPAIRRLTSAEAAARLYVTGLNTLAHPEAGLPAILGVAAAVPCFGVVSADLGATCRLIESTVNGLAACSSGSS